MKKKIVLIIVYSLVVLLVFFIILEIAVRLWGYSEHNIYDPIYMPFSNSDEIPYIHKPNLRNKRARGNIIINTDCLGLRAIEVEDSYYLNQNNEYRIAVVGDSVTFGEGVHNTEDTFCQVLENSLNKSQDTKYVKIFNFAADAYSVKEMAAITRHRIIPIKPDLIILSIIPDDFDISRTPEVDKWGYQYNNKISGFMHKDSIIKYLLRKIRFVYLLRDLKYKLDNGYLFSNEDNTNIKKIDFNQSFKYITEFQNVVEQNNIPYIVLLLPGNSFDNILKLFDDNNITYLDLTYLKNEFTYEKFHASKFDRHPSFLVHRRIGEESAQYIKKFLK